MEPDDLYTLRTCYYLGHYKLALEEGENISHRTMSANLATERLEFVTRANIANGTYSGTSMPMNDGSTASLQMLHVLYLITTTTSSSSKNNDDTSSSRSSTEEFVHQIESLLSHNNTNNNTNNMNMNDVVTKSYNTDSSLQLFAGYAFLHLGLLKEALQLQSVQFGISMEHIALKLQIYMKYDRLDLAKEQLQLMKQVDEDATLTVLCSAMIATMGGGVSGKDGGEEAVYMYQTLSEQYGPSLMLLNGLAVAYMKCGNFEAAAVQIEEALTNAMDDDSNSNGNGNGRVVADCLVNAVAIYQNLGNVSKVESTLQTLKSKYGGHPYVSALNTVEQAFQRVCAQYA